MVAGLVPAALGELERRAAREVRHEAVEQDVLAVARAPHRLAQRRRRRRELRQPRAVHQRRARQHQRVRAAPLAAVAPRALRTHIPTSPTITTHVALHILTTHKLNVLLLYLKNIQLVPPSPSLHGNVCWHWKTPF